MKHLRILHAIFSSHIAGSERYCIDLANRQALLGHKVHVVGNHHSPIRQALNPAVTFHGLRFRVLRGVRIRRLIRRHAFDLCHGHLSHACKALAGTPQSVVKVATLHVGYKPQQHSRLNGLICVNHAQLSRITGYENLVRVIPNWLPLPKAVAPSGAGLRRELGLGANDLLIGAVGRLNPSKGMDVLISAFRSHAPAKATLAIIGQGPDYARFRRMCGGDPRIHLLGFRDNVGDFLDELDLFISPSREESFGLAILEAMSRRIPIISTAAEGPAEYLLDQPVQLVPPGEADALGVALAETCGRLLAGGLPRRINYDLRPFDPAKGVAAVMQFYADALGASAPQPIPVEPAVVAAS